MDQVMHDIRNVFNHELEVRLSEPFIKIAETICDTSSVKAQCETPNGKNKLTMLAKPLEKNVSQHLEMRAGDLLGIESSLEQLGWDALSANNVWAFGPQDAGTNVLVDYSLDFEMDKPKVGMVKNSIVQGFKWATREGPLSDEPMKNVSFHFLGGLFANEPIYRGGGQIIPTSRRVCYSSFLLGNPRIMEPVNKAEILCPYDCMEVIQGILFKRRAHITHEEPKAGTPHHCVHVEIPVLESFGFETDIRTQTMGQAMVLQQFDHWAVSPGDPLDKNI
jgi:116 kDa U5 small nuclear ribonucleoprotein component